MGPGLLYRSVKIHAIYNNFVAQVPSPERASQYWCVSSQIQPKRSIPVMINHLLLRILLNFGKYAVVLALCFYAGQLHAQINNLDDTSNTQWLGQGSNGAFFGVANVTDFITDGQSKRFDVACSSPPCMFVAAYNLNLA